MEIETKNGKKEKLFWIEYFEGANDLGNNQNLIKKEIEINYIEKEFYNHNLKEYNKIKIITKLKIKE